MITQSPANNAVMQISKHLHSLTFNSSSEYAYKDASHYWPLDPILGIEDLVTGDVASIFGDEGVALKGRGNGFMEVKMGSSALMLGEYREKCLVAPEDCKYGITVTKWIRIEKTISSNKSFDLLKMKASDFIDIIRISFNDFESEFFIRNNIHYLCLIVMQTIFSSFSPIFSIFKSLLT